MYLLDGFPTVGVQEPFNATVPRTVPSAVAGDRPAVSALRLDSLAQLPGDNRAAVHQLLHSVQNAPGLPGRLEGVQSGEHDPGQERRGPTGHQLTCYRCVRRDGPHDEARAEGQRQIQCISPSHVTLKTCLV